MQILVSQNLLNQNQDVEPKIGFFESEGSENFTIMFDFDDILVSESDVFDSGDVVKYIRPYAVETISQFVKLQMCDIVICTIRYSSYIDNLK